jgi:signal transduction histidine kinase
MTAAASEIATAERTAASLATRLEVPPSEDELARLAVTFNAMLDRLQGAFETQRRFIADASHELRTPLTAIRGHVEVLIRQSSKAGGERLSPETLDALEDVRRESERMGRLIGDLLLLARSDAADAAGPLAAEPVPLDQVAHEAVRTARGLAAGQYLEVFAPRPVLVRGDADRLRQLLLALLDNALRHTPSDGRIVVELGVEADREAVLRVRDSGEGIAPEDLPHVFERFYRADGARARATGGTGLGLGDRQGDRRGARRLDRGRQPTRRRRDVHRPPAAGGAGAGRRSEPADEEPADRADDHDDDERDGDAEERLPLEPESVDAGELFHPVDHAAHLILTTLPAVATALFR